LTSVPRKDPGAKINPRVPKKTATHQTFYYLQTGNFWARWAKNSNFKKSSYRSNWGDRTTADQHQLADGFGAFGLKKRPQQRSAARAL
jgi:hypothetical protein